ncbi:MAG: single-stranded-DNA-specific exonuclease RecJ [Bdellovibrionales bacterium]|nr:single-stranded-DNA-specific exonuclease RecJ [Bdellovibrionales bacterium]
MADLETASGRFGRREWRLRPLGAADAGLDAPAAEAEILKLAAETGLTPVTIRVCWLRGLRDGAAIRAYLTPRLEDLTPALKIADMDRAAARLMRARDAGEPVRIFGDYDVDGTCGAALLTWVFRELGIRADATQPDRFKDGYGLNTGAVEQAAADGMKVLVTVDCGITSFDQAARARELGLDLIILDHHQLDPVRGMPEAYAVVNPQRPDCESGLKQLCGCGVAFYLSIALRAKGREAGWFTGEGAGPEPRLKEHLDLVVMATAADQVPLVGDNRILVRHGMEVLRRSTKPGVRALMEAAGVAGRSLSPGHLGFVLGPRINASGRLQNASLALELLTTEDAAVGAARARELERLNKERATIQDRIWDEVRARVEQGISEGKFKNGVVVADRGWHEGVVGIVATRVTEAFRKPAIVIALREDLGKGSARTWGGRNVLEAIRLAAGDHLLGFGGHKHAAGLSIALDHVDAFAQAFDDAMATVDAELENPPLFIEGDMRPEDLEFRAFHELEGLGPFGPGNPEPVFRLRASVQDQRVLKGRHLKLQLGPVGTGSLEAMWFGAAEDPEVNGKLGAPEGFGEADWAGVPELNRFNGRVTPTFRIRDWKPL